MPIDMYMLLNRLKEGITDRIRDQAHVITGSYDEVVTRLGRLSAAKIPWEGVRELEEKPRVGKRRDTPVTLATCMENGTIQSVIGM